MSLKQNLHVVTTTYPKKEKALEEVKQRNYCHKNTDKRDASVIFDVKNYIIESERQLSNTKDHINLEHDSTTENDTAIKKLWED